MPWTKSPLAAPSSWLSQTRSLLVLWFILWIGFLPPVYPAVWGVRPISDERVPMHGEVLVSPTHPSDGNSRDGFCSCYIKHPWSQVPPGGFRQPPARILTVHGG